MRSCSHYLQQAYTDAFTDQHGLLWVYDRHHHSVRALPPRVVGAARGFYQYRRRDGTTFDLEHHPWLDECESGGIALLPRVRTGVLSPEAKLSFARYIALSALRTPAYQACMLKAVLRDHTTASDADLDRLGWQYRRDWGNDVAHISGVHRTVAMGARLHVRQIIMGVARHAPTIAGLTWRVLHTTATFLTSDNPVTIVMPGGGFPPQRYLLDPAQDVGQRIVFPLTPQCCLLMRHGDGATDVLSADEDLTREINAYVVTNALRYVLAPQEGLAALLPLGTSWTRGAAPSTVRTRPGVGQQSAPSPLPCAPNQSRPGATTV